MGGSNSTSAGGGGGPSTSSAAPQGLATWGDATGRPETTTATVEIDLEAFGEERCLLKRSDTVTTFGGGMEGPRRFSLLERGAYLFIWVAGLWVTIHLMMEFSNELKPLVLALIFVSILETIVQFWEKVFWYATTWARISLRYVWLSLRIVLRKCCRGCCNCVRRCRCNCCLGCVPLIQRIERDELETRFLVVKGFRSMKWHPSLAGTNLMIRCVAVAVTLLIIGGVFVLIFIGLKLNVDQMLMNSEGYRRMAVRVFSALETKSDGISDSLPGWVSNSTRDSIREKVQETWERCDPDKMATSLQENMAFYLTGFLANTETIAMGAVFFLLYTILCLCDPLHINQHGSLVGMLNKRIVFPDVPTLEGDLKKFVQSEQVGRTNSKGSVRRSPSERLLGKTLDLDEVIWDAPDIEVQVHIYRIVWQYMGLTVVINGVFALAAWALLSNLGLDLGGVIAVISFFLSFIPELGTIVSTLLPLPIILFAPDCDILGTCTTTPPPPDLGDAEPVFADWEDRSKRMVMAFAGMLLIKFIVSNIFGSWLFSRSKVLSGQLKGLETRETHPVIVLFAVVLFGRIWGTVGMLISVPMLSVMRLMLSLGYLGSKLK